MYDAGGKQKCVPKLNKWIIIFYLYLLQWGKMYKCKQLGDREEIIQVPYLLDLKGEKPLVLELSVKCWEGRQLL